jgi:hypothetical protein
MSELFYFSFADLMVRVEYSPEANALRYGSHRKMTFNERVVVEQYLLTNVAQKTEYYKQPASLFVYLGVEAQLAKDLNLFHLKSTLKHLVDKENDVKASVQGLISSSMQNYYSEQIGDAIIAMRQEVANGISQERALPLRRRMEELVQAYNSYSAQQLSVAQVVPAELQPYFGFEAKPGARQRGGRMIDAREE